jgi:hypothetical protein
MGFGFAACIKRKFNNIPLADIHKYFSKAATCQQSTANG